MPYSWQNKIKISCENEDMVGKVEILKGSKSYFEYVKLTRRKTDHHLAFGKSTIVYVKYLIKFVTL